MSFVRPLCVPVRVHALCAHVPFILATRTSSLDAPPTARPAHPHNCPHTCSLQALCGRHLQGRGWQYRLPGRRVSAWCVCCPIWTTAPLPHDSCPICLSLSTGAVVRARLTAVNAASCTADHRPACKDAGASPLSSAFRYATMLLWPCTNLRKKFAKPKNYLSSWRVVGVGQSATACTFAGSAFKPSRDTTNPR